MNHKNLEQLDFFRVREIISSFAMTQEGKQTVLSILPYTDKKQISSAKNLSKDWADYLQAGNTFCTSGSDRYRGCRGLYPDHGTIESVRR